MRLTERKILTEQRNVGVRERGDHGFCAEQIEFRGPALRSGEMHKPLMDTENATLKTGSERDVPEVYT